MPSHASGRDIRQPNAARADDVGPECADGVRQNDLLRKAEHKQFCAVLGPCRRAAVRAVVQLVGHLAVLDDRPDDQLREEKHIHCKCDEVFLRRNLSGADVDLIADDFENVVADAQRQHRADVQRRQPKMRDLVDRVDQEVGILKVPPARPN